MVTSKQATLAKQLEDAQREKAKADLKREHWRRRWHDADNEVQRIREEIRLASYPPEPTTDGTVVQFRKRHAPSGRDYLYAAIRAVGKWHVTGSRSPQWLTWTELCDWVRRDNVLMEGRELRRTPLNETARPFEPLDAEPPF